jgi:hypothetical protein
LKKLTAIFLVTIFLFNLGGYRLWFHYEQERSDKNIESFIDNKEYNEDELITLKVALSLPYHHDTKEFERVTGEINFKGKVYKYVKRKIENGNLVLMCLPDINKTLIQNAKDDFFKTSADLTQDNSSKKNNSKSISFKSLPGDYDEYVFSISISSCFNISKDFERYNLQQLLTSPNISPEQPPDTSCS